MAYNDEYTPSCATDCTDQLLAAVGDTGCASDLTVEMAEINFIHLDEKDPTTPGSPKTPIAGYSLDADNATVILTWRALHDNATASKIRSLVGIGEKPEPNESAITLHKGITYSIGTRHVMTYTINVINDASYKFLRTLQACKGQYHLWFGTDTYLYGADKGIIADIEKIVFPKTGGRTDNSKCIITFGWNAKSDPVRDALPYEVF
jgi:hypothetical protein